MTQDNGMDVSPSWAELKAERDALAAHVETAKGVMTRLVDTPRYTMGTRPVAVQEYLDWLNLNPATSLDRLVAEKQAEALEALWPKLCIKADQQITRHTARLTRGRGHDN